jgi:hypothetical protein
VPALATARVSALAEEQTATTNITARTRIGPEESIPGSSTFQMSP